MTEVHPGFVLQDIRPSTLNAQVSGMDFLPDGRLAISTWYGFGSTKGDVYLVDKVQGGEKSQVTFKKFASGLNEPLGLTVVDGVIYALVKDGLVRLPDANKDDNVDAVETVVSGWQYQSSDAKSLEFALSLVHKDSLFYAGLATRWPVGGTQSQERGCIISLNPKQAKTFTTVACGTRTPNGLFFGPGGELFTTENQGNWVPDSKLIHVKAGNFYGVHKPINPHPFESKTETPPAIWMPHNDISISPTQPVYLTSGVFKGQMLAGDNNMGSLQRYFLEKVGGAYQGMITGFSGGLEAAANRIVTGPDGAIYVGGEGVGAAVWSGWGWHDKFYGLSRLAEKPNTTFFDVLAIRSLGANQFEIEFTEPANANATQTSHYALRTRGYTPGADYGCCKDNWSNLTVSSATLSSDKKKVTLQVSGLKLKNSVHFKFTTLTSEANRSLWATQAWYTLNAFGPGEDIPVPVSGQKLDASHSKFQVVGSRLALPGFSGKASFEILDMKGQRVLHKTISSNSIEAPVLPKNGIYLLRLTLPSGEILSQRYSSIANSDRYRVR